MDSAVASKANRVRERFDILNEQRDDWFPWFEFFLAGGAIAASHLLLEGKRLEII